MHCVEGCTSKAAAIAMASKDASNARPSMPSTQNDAGHWRWVWVTQVLPVRGSEKLSECTHDQVPACPSWMRGWFPTLGFTIKPKEDAKTEATLAATTVAPAEAINQ